MNDTWISSERAVNDVVGYVLIIGLVITGAGLVVTAGAVVIGDSQTVLSEYRAEKALTQLDSKISQVAYNQDDSTVVDIATDTGQYSIDNTSGWIRLEVREIRNDTTPSWAAPSLFNETLGAVRFESEAGVVIAYQGGGVWRDTKNGNGGLMISPPGFHYRDATLTLPLIVVDGERQSVSSNIRIQKNSSDLHFPVSGNKNLTNPLETHELTLTVQSDYYRAWGNYFEERTDGTAEFDDENETATIFLRTPTDKRQVNNALTATAGSGSMKIAGNQGRTDSYNSTEGNYTDSQDDNGNVTIAGDLEVTGGSSLIGNAKVGDDFKCSGNSGVTGDVRFGNSKTVSGACSVGSIGALNQDIETDPPVTTYVKSTVDDIDENNDNSGAPINGNDRIDYTGLSATLTPGDYYLEELSPSTGQTLLIDAPAGSKTQIAIDDFVQMTGGDVIVQGEGRVEFYVKGNETTLLGNQFEMVSGSTLTTDGQVQRSPQIWVYGTETMQAQLGDPGGSAAIMEGVLYAPARDGVPPFSRLDVEHGTLFGGAYVGESELHQGQPAKIHFDEALTDERTILEDESVVLINYLHVTTNQVEVDN